jgi:hypothetical protein
MIRRKLITAGCCGVLAIAGSMAGAPQSSTTLIQVAPPPNDPSELITSQPEAVEAPEARTAVIALLRRVFQKSAFAATGVPYTVKISFSAFGRVQDVGPGEMEETRNASGARRWIGHLGNFALTRIITDRMYDQGSTGPIPFRLNMAREYAFGAPLNVMNSIRTANATLNGVSMTCILTSVRPSAAPGRDWSEIEYCIDPLSELLRVYSAAPGIYATYGYSNSASFHGRLVPDQITISEAGSIVLQGSIGVKDPDSLDPSLFAPTSQMSTGGVGLQPPTHRVLNRSATSPVVPIQPVVVHAILSPEGSVVEAEALQTPDAPLSQSAVDLVKATKYDATIDYGYPPQQEIFVTVQ